MLHQKTCRLVDELGMEWAGVVVVTDQTRWDPQACLEQQPVALEPGALQDLCSCWAGNRALTRWACLTCSYVTEVLQASNLLVFAALVVFAVESEQLGQSLVAWQGKTAEEIRLA